jgi:hypothetical protein
MSAMARTAAEKKLVDYVMKKDNALQHQNSIEA